MKNITRRNFMRLSGAVVLGAAAGALTGCGEDAPGTVIPEDGAVDVPFPKSDAAEADKYTAVGSFAVYPMSCESIQDSQEGYGRMQMLYLVIRNDSGADYVLDKTKVTVWMDEAPCTVVAVDGGYGNEDAELQSSALLPDGEETTVCIYVQSSTAHGTRFVLRLGSQKARITV